MKEKTKNPIKSSEDLDLEDEKLVDELIPPPSNNLNQDLAEEEGDKEELFKTLLAKVAKIDPLMRRILTMKKIHIGPSRKVLPPPSADELPDEVLKLREELLMILNDETIRRR